MFNGFYLKQLISLHPPHLVSSWRRNLKSASR